MLGFVIIMQILLDLDIILGDTSHLSSRVISHGLCLQSLSISIIALFRAVALLLLKYTRLLLITYLRISLDKTPCS